MNHKLDCTCLDTFEFPLSNIETFSLPSVICDKEMFKTVQLHLCVPETCSTPAWNMQQSSLPISPHTLMREVLIKAPEIFLREANRRFYPSFRDERGGVTRESVNLHAGALTLLLLQRILVPHRAWSYSKGQRLELLASLDWRDADCKVEELLKPLWFNDTVEVAHLELAFGKDKLQLLRQRL